MILMRIVSNLSREKALRAIQMKLLRGVLTYDSSEILVDENMDFAIHTNPGVDVVSPGSVRTYCTEERCEKMPPVVTSPELLKDRIHATLRPGVRAMVGNAGSELTFRHITQRARKNVQHMLCWAEAAYELLGSQLVLAPMDFDIIHDVNTGGHLLAWAAKHHVPLAVFCGYRFLFPEDAFSHIREFCTRVPMRGQGNPYDYPYQEVSEAIRRSGADVWTGSGYHEGLAAGVLEKAERFGLAAVFTTQVAWRCWKEQNASERNRPENLC